MLFAAYVNILISLGISIIIRSCNKQRKNERNETPNSMEQKLIVTQLFKKFPAVYETGTCSEDPCKSEALCSIA
jgi:hypothetical protein